MGANEPERALPNLVLGEPQTLIADRALEGLYYTPSQGTSLLSWVPTTRLILSVGYTSVLVEGSDIENLSQAISILEPGPPGSYDNGAAVIGAVVELGDTLYGFYEAQDVEGLPIAGAWYGSIGLATAERAATVWERQGQVLTSDRPKSWEAYPNQLDRGVADPSAVLTRDGRYLLLYYVERSRLSDRRLDIGIARADLSQGPPHPNPGALVLSAPFTAPVQFLQVTVDPNVSQPGLLNLTGRKVRARIRLVSGSAPHVWLAASGAPDFAFHGAFVGASNLIPGEWLTVELDLATSTNPAFDPSQILGLGVQIASVDPSGGPVVIEVDTETDG